MPTSEQFEYGKAPPMPTLHPVVDEDKVMLEEGLAQWVVFANNYPERICQTAIDFTVDTEAMELDAKCQKIQLAQSLDHTQQMSHAQRANARKFSHFEVVIIFAATILLAGAAGVAVGWRTAGR